MTAISPWLFRLDLPTPLIAGLEAILSPDERARAAALRHDVDQRRFIARRAQLRMLLADLIGTRPEAVLFARGPHGKPYLPSYPDLRFNTSSAGTLGLCVVALKTEVGCDMAADEDVPLSIEIARLLFHDREHRDFAALPEAMRRRAFLEIWTRKEAYLKAAGIGLSRDLSTFSVFVGKSCVSAIHEGRHDWQFKSLDLSSGFIAVLATAAGSGSVDVVPPRLLM